MALTPGELDAIGNFMSQDCMARYIDDALNLVPMTVPGGDPLDPVMLLVHRRRVLIAISQGIIDYLKDRAQDSFLLVSVPVTGSVANGFVTLT